MSRLRCGSKEARAFSNQVCPAAAIDHEEEATMVMIGVDPHKGSHMAVALDDDEAVVDEVHVRAVPGQRDELLVWADAFGARTWATESAGGLGYPLAQQLVAVGEEVLDGPPSLAARVRVLGSGRSAKNDANDARSVAVAALRATSLRPVRREDHLTVLRMLTRRHRDLGRERNRVACRLHALICELIPGGIPTKLRNDDAFRLLNELTPTDVVTRARQSVAVELVDDLCRIDTARRDSKRRVEAAMAASATSLTERFGIGPVCAAILLTQSGDVARFATKDHYAAYNGTARSRCRPGIAAAIASAGAATARSIRPST
jgi:transposase